MTRSVCALRLLFVVGLIAITGCGGVAEERVGTIEANLRLLDQNAAQKLLDHEKRVAALEGRLVAAEQGVAAVQQQLQAVAASPVASAGQADPQLAGQVASLTASLAELRQQQEGFVQQVNANLAAAAAASGSAAPAPVVVAPATPAMPLDDLAQALAVEPDDGPEREDEETFTVTAAWLRWAVKAVAASDKKPAFKANRAGGVAVTKVMPKDPLGRLGIKNGDVLLAIGGKDVEDSDGLMAAIKAASPGKVVVGVKRKKRELEITYTIK